MNRIVLEIARRDCWTIKQDIALCVSEDKWLWIGLHCILCVVLQRTSGYGSGFIVYCVLCYRGQVVMDRASLYIVRFSAVFR